MPMRGDPPVNQSDLFDRYGLALHLVSDPDVAGDLFMGAGDAPTLLKRANRWRLRHGLEPVAMPAAWPPLTPAEAEHALHLARRGRLRRWFHLGAAVVGLVALLLASRLAAPLAGPVQGLAADPVYAGPALQQVDHPAGYRFAVHRVAAEPGSVTLWWSATGRGARGAAESLKPLLALDSLAIEWMAPSETSFATSRSDRLVGRSNFETIVTFEQEAWLTFDGPQPRRSGLFLLLPLDRTEDETARVIRLDQEISQGPVAIRLHSLVLGKGYSQVRYATSTSIARAPALYSLKVGNVRLNRKGPLLPTRDGDLIEATFEQLPEEMDQLTLSFTSVFVTLPPRTYPLPGEAEVFTRSGATATVVFALEDQSWGAAALGYFTGAGGERYPATVAFQVEGTPARHRIMLRSEDVPPEVTLVGFTLTGLRRHYHFYEIPVELNP